jgi:CRISPR-associated endonuclease/helicase Cas3
MELIAHIADDGRVQSLKEHACCVADMAGLFAESFGGREWARLVGLVHDAGKASTAFQRRIAGSTEQVDHSSAGAQMLASRYGLPGKMLSYACAGHHGGMPDFASDECGRSSLCKRLQKEVEDYSAFEDEVELPATDDIVSASSLPRGMALSKGDSRRAAFAAYMAVRMTFSSLVDADYLDTEKFMTPQRANLRGGRPTILELRHRLSDYLERLEKGANATPVNEARSSSRLACLAKAKNPTGLYTLSLPTGAGKTLTSIDFALEHAIENGQERVIVAIPFTSIVEQTAAVLRSVFGTEAVLEHHSSYEFKEDKLAEEVRSLATENWDAPLVVTTNVQLFESMYAAKPARARKTHNVANSVVIIDEAQALPDELLSPCLAALEEMSCSYNTTVVLCSATQPNFGRMWPFGAKPIELADEQSFDRGLFEGRTSIGYLGQIEIANLIERVTGAHQALCVLSTRRGAAEVFDCVAKNDCGKKCYHLSAMMVPEHRSTVLKEVRQRLDQGQSCILVSTQVVEAGVDLDFPYVLREVAGIDSVIQAAGRCNREGKMAQGMVHVFDCPDVAYGVVGWLGNMRELAKEVIKECDDPFGQQGVKEFFGKRYAVANTDAKGIFAEASDAKRMAEARWNFARHDMDFNMVEGGGEPVFVPWGQRGRQLLDRMDEGFTPNSQELQPFTVSAPIYMVKALEERGLVGEKGPYRAVLSASLLCSCYSADKGLYVPSGGEGIFI